MRREVAKELYYLVSFLCVAQAAVLFFAHVPAIKRWVIPVAFAQFVGEALVPGEGLGCEVKPGEEAHSRKHVHAEFVHFGKNRFDGIVRCHRHPVSEQAGRIEGSGTEIVRRKMVSTIQIVPVPVLRLLEHDDVHANVMHAAHHLGPLVIGHLAQDRIVNLALGHLRQIETAPCSVHPPGGADLRFKDLDLFANAPRALARFGHQQERVLARLRFGGPTHRNAGGGMRRHRQGFMVQSVIRMLLVREDFNLKGSRCIAVVPHRAADIQHDLICYWRGGNQGETDLWTCSGSAGFRLFMGRGWREFFGRKVVYASDSKARQMRACSQEELVVIALRLRRPQDFSVGQQSRK